MTGRQAIIPIRTSERTCFKNCRAQWHWAYNEHLEPIRQRNALEFGTLVHAALALRYKPGKVRGPHPAGTFVKLYDQAIERGMTPINFRGDEYDDDGVKLKGRELGEAMLVGFVDTFGKDEKYRVIKPELSFQIDIHDENTGQYLFTYVSTTDVLVEDMEKQAFGYLEWKTGEGGHLAPLGLDEQANSYWTFGTMYLEKIGVLKPGQDVKFMEYTFLSKRMPDTRPKNELGQALNKDGTVSKRQPGPLFRRERTMRGAEERRQTFRRAVQEAREMRLCREGKLAVYKNPGQHCKWCGFLDMCEVHETGEDWRAVRDGLYRRWSPYEDHESNLTAVELVRKELVR